MLRAIEHRTGLMTSLRSRYGGRYRYHWTRLLAFAALDATAAVLTCPRRRIGAIDRGRRADPAVGQSPAPRRILAIRVDGLGDVIVTLPALEALRAAFPNARLDLLSSPVGAELMRGDPRVDRVLTTRFLFEDTRRGRNRAIPRVEEWMSIVRELRREKYDLAIDFRGDFRTIGWLAYGSGAPRRLSWFNTSAGRPLLTDGLEGPGPLHEVEANLRLVRAVGAVPVSHTPRIEVGPAAAAQAEARLRSLGLGSERPRVGFHCFAISPLRTWPPERFAGVIEQLAQEPGVGAVLLGAAAEGPASRKMLASTRANVTSLVGETTLAELPALLSRLDLVVCLDSGIMHLAAAVGTPTVSLFGPGQPSRWRPLSKEATVLWQGLPCSPCRDIQCLYPTNRCMREISVEQVVEAARFRLGSRHNP